MSDMLAVAVEWLAATGAPNWLVLLALVTNLSFWSRRVRARVGPLLDRYLSADSNAGGAKTPDDDPRE